ncbi:DUF572-domain-containing protein, partial [Auricularia subglabra TFB-10046 SS5]
GFNKYYPPDYDGEKHGSLNSYRGKHALGVRARKIDQGILIVRFELPFNIWVRIPFPCGHCDQHIGMGVRYNAEKRKIGSYYTTPIYAFRCKCHLCDGWFEIQTDPKNTRYVVTEGARQKMEDWNPEENGGFAVHGTALPSKHSTSAPVDPLAALEKTAEQAAHSKTVVAPRLEQLQAHADRMRADPYAHSLRVRKQFRAQKKEDNERKKKDDAFKEKYGLSEELQLERDDDAALKEEARLELLKERQRRLAEPPTPSTALRRLKAGSSSASSPSASGAAGLKAALLRNTYAKLPSRAKPSTSTSSLVVRKS